MHQPYAIPISVKGIVFENGKVWLRKNERGEWELPGGKLDKGEQPTETVIREMSEELGYTVEVVDLVSAYAHRIPGSIDEQEGVLILSYLCQIVDKTGGMEHLGEGGKAEFRLFADREIADLAMPQCYKDALDLAW